MMAISVETLKVIVAEDHELYREGLTFLLSELQAGINVIAVSDFPATLTSLEENPDTDMLLLDLNLPGTKDLEGLKIIRQRFPLLAIVVISSLDFYIGVQEMIECGVNGFIAKSTPIVAMKEGLRKVFDGELVIITQSEENPVVNLPARQLETLQLMSKGYSNAKISECMGISVGTVKEYVSNILTHLVVKNRNEAVVKARQLGLLPPG